MEMMTHSHKYFGSEFTKNLRTESYLSVYERLFSKNGEINR